jgi:hypothetical protein
MPNHTDTPDVEFEDVFLRSYDLLMEQAESFRVDLMERRNRGALLIEIVEPINDGDKKVDVGDVVEVTSPEGKLKEAEVVQVHRVMAYHAKYGPVACRNMLVEVLDPDRMTRDDFEDLYGEEESQEEAEALGPNCECGADRSDCQQNQELFGIHINEDEKRKL